MKAQKEAGCVLEIVLTSLLKKCFNFFLRAAKNMTHKPVILRMHVNLHNTAPFNKIFRFFCSENYVSIIIITLSLVLCLDFLKF